MSAAPDPAPDSGPHSGHGPAWRPMAPEDVPAVMALSERVHPAFYERPAMFLDRLALFPEGSLVCEVPHASPGIAGYAIAYPTSRADPPPLDTVLGRLPEGADALYVHDVAVDPAFRGRGLSEGAVRRLLALADRGFPAAVLISIYGTPPFWRRFGFEPRPDLIRPAKLASYGEEAVFMLRANPSRRPDAQAGRGAALERVEEALGISGPSRP